MKGPLEYTRRQGPAGLVSLDLNEAAQEADPAYKARVLELLADAQLRRYPPMDATPARQAAAQLYRWSVEGTLVGNGSNELLAAALRALAPPGGRVAVFAPSFSLYPVLLRRAQLQPLVVPLQAPHFAIPREELLSAVRQADLALVCSPNNPTGGEVGEDLWEELLQLGKPVLWDGAYLEFGRPLDSGQLLTRFPQLLQSRTLSKVWGAAGLRAGALLGCPELIAQVRRQLLPFAPGLAVWAAFQAAAEMPQVGLGRAQEVVAERERQVAQLRAVAGVEVVAGGGNFFLLRCGDFRGEELQEELQKRGILVREVPELSALGFVRVSVGAREEGDLLLAAVREVCGGA